MEQAHTDNSDPRRAGFYHLIRLLGLRAARQVLGVHMYNELGRINGYVGVSVTLYLPFCYFLISIRSAECMREHVYFLRFDWLLVLYSFEVVFHSGFSFFPSLFLLWCHPL